MPFEAHDFWQEVYPEGHLARPAEGYSELYPATLPDRREIALPIRVLPGDGSRAVASLILNQASFAVEDALADAVAGLLHPLGIELIVGVPTLGLGLANAVARRLGHKRMVPLGVSRKFWYRDELSEPMRSITSPDQAKRLFIDPRMLPLLTGRRIAVVDDVISTGSSMSAVLRLLSTAGTRPVAIAAAMLQGSAWNEALPTADIAIHAATRTPILQRTPEGRWFPVLR